MNGLNIPVQPRALPQKDFNEAVRLMGFDYGDDLFHVLAFDFGDDGGAIAIWREGDEFCARISLDSLATFWREARDAHAAKATGSAA